MKTIGLMFFLVLCIVGLNLGTGIILKTMGSQEPSQIVLVVGFGAVGILSVLRLLIWYLAHRRYPLSTFYPLTSLIFPAALITSVFYHDPIGPFQVIGAMLITAGVFWLGRYSARNLRD